ncbi:uncharacterized protein LOC141702446 [Apium graveolens]|uniref:uncharacterized protein LOC141702446 n=1 Tax=Apium graveolens TaxID=4045 RepID=UPI003D7AA446
MADDLTAEPVAAEELMENEGANECIVVDTIDPPPPGPRKYELSLDIIDNKVAFGVIFDDGDMASTIHGVPLKPKHARVSVDEIIQGDAQVPVPIAGEIETVEQAVGSLLAWSRDLIIYAPNGPTPFQRKRKVKEPAKKGDLQIAQDLFGKVVLSDNVPERYKMLYKHASCFMKATRASIQIPCDFDVFGVERTIFLLHENIIALSEFKMLGQTVISTYMAFLCIMVHDRKSLDMYAFVDPSRYKFYAEFETYIVSILNDSVLHFMPFNQNMHWMLVIIWESEIFFLNPLSHATRFPELENALTGAVRSYNAQKGRVIKNPKNVNFAGCPKQPGGTEFGYCVMRYMKDIIEDKDMNFFKLWASKNRKSYIRMDLDVVRMETLGYIEGFM